MISKRMVDNLPATRRKAQAEAPKKPAWNSLSNNELRQAISRIVNSCTNAEDVNRRAKDELGYPFRIAVTYSQPNAAGQRMSMFMATPKDGETLT